MGGLLLSPIMLMSLRAQEVLTLDLQKALDIALSESPTVKVAEMEIEKKEYAKKGSYAALFPQINFSGDYNRTLKKQVMYMDNAFNIGDMMSPMFVGMENALTDIVPGYPTGTLTDYIMKEFNKGAEGSSDGGIAIGRDNNWNFGFSAGMPLVNVQLWKSLDISGIDVELAIEQARSSKINMVNQVKKAYYGVMLANDSYHVLKTSYGNAMDNYNDIKAKFDQGLVAEYDLIRADVAVKNVEPNMLQAENAVKLSQWQLKALLGMDLDMNIECTGELSDYEESLIGDYLSIDTTLNYNSDLRQLDLQTRQLDKMLGMQKAEFLPTLSLSGVYQWTAMENTFKFKDYHLNPYSMVGVSLSIPIFSGGQRVNKVKQTQVTLNQMKWQRGDAVRNLQLAVRNYMDNMTTCVKRYDATMKGVKQAEKGYQIAKKRYETGAGTLLELNDAELSMTTAKLNFNQSIYDYVVAKSELEKILGQYNEDQTKSR